VDDHARTTIRDMVIAVAKAKRTVNYAELFDLIDADIRNPEHRDRLFRTLDDVDREEPVLVTAVVVAQETGLPGHGFFALARELGRLGEGSEVAFHQQELRRVWEHYSRWPHTPRLLPWIAPAARRGRPSQRQGFLPGARRAPSLQCQAKR